MEHVSEILPLALASLLADAGCVECDNPNLGESGMWCRVCEIGTIAEAE